MNCFMSYNPNVAKEVKITTWIKEFDGASPVYPSFPNDGDVFIVFDTDEAKEPSVNKTYTSGEWADTSSGGGGGGYPTVTVNVSSEKLYCFIQFQPDLNPETESNEIVNALYNNGSYYMDQCNLEPDAVDSGVTADFLMIGDSFTLIPWADFSLPNAVSITGSATFDDETKTITVTGDCSIHLIGFDE